MAKIRLVLQKELLELRSDRSLVLGILFMPLLLTIFSIGITYALGQIPDEDTADLGIVLVDPTLAGMSALELGQAVIGKQFSILFLLMPVVIPSVISSYSIVGEKTNRTLEPLLATPIHTWELLLGKSLAALIPAVLITWACSAVFSLGVTLVAVTPRVFGAIISPAWLIVLLICGPMLSLIAIVASVAISARVNDPRTAQQLAAVIVVPIMMIFFGQLAGVLVLSPAVAIGAALVLSQLAALAIWAATKLFQREVILTRWR